MPKKRTLVICPGRGSYNSAELGYLAKRPAAGEMLKEFDLVRALRGQESITALDGASKYSTGKHLRGDNASGLIYACSVADFTAIDQSTHEIVAVTGNSMGWYTALACAGVMGFKHGFSLCNTMAAIMQDRAIGGQILYPFVDENWIEKPGQRDALLKLCQDIENLHLSIDFGGMVVFAGDTPAIRFLEEHLDKVGTRFPLTLSGHAAFHSPLQWPNAETAFETIPEDLFGALEIPLVDGRGKIWYPRTSDPAALRRYTLGEQVTSPYHFTRAVENSLKEFAPEVIIELGPGSSLSTAIGQIMVRHQWDGIASKRDFEARQNNNPILISMGVE